MATTPTYAFPYQALTDPPDGAGLGEDLALAVETKIGLVARAAPMSSPCWRPARAAPTRQ
jgi:hypothetical protein